jgi:hypothetical protein
MENEIAEENETFADVYQDDDIKLDAFPDVSECRKMRAEFKRAGFGQTFS